MVVKKKQLNKQWCVSTDFYIHGNNPAYDRNPIILYHGAYDSDEQRKQDSEESNFPCQDCGIQVPRQIFDHEIEIQIHAVQHLLTQVNFFSVSAFAVSRAPVLRSIRTRRIGSDGRCHNEVFIPVQSPLIAIFPDPPPTAHCRTNKNTGNDSCGIGKQRRNVFRYHLLFTSTGKGDAPILCAVSIMLGFASLRLFSVSLAASNRKRYGRNSCACGRSKDQAGQRGKRYHQNQKRYQTERVNEHIQSL